MNEQNDFDTKLDDDFTLTTQESKKMMRRGVNGLVILVLAAVVVVTAAHAILLVTSQAVQDQTAFADPLISSILNGIRIAFPIIVEACAVVVGIGFFQSLWRGKQKWIGGGIEVIWVLFAIFNMVTYFAVERGAPLQGWQVFWVNYGLPASAIITGSLLYILHRSDPDHLRKNEEVAAGEKRHMIRFAARRDVFTSKAMQSLERHKAWLDTINELRAQGYREHEIAYLAQFVPELRLDANKNGTPDILELGNGDNPRIVASKATPEQIEQWRQDSKRLRRNHEEAPIVVDITKESEGNTNGVNFPTRRPPSSSSGR